MANPRLGDAASLVLAGAAEYAMRPGASLRGTLVLPVDMLRSTVAALSGFVLFAASQAGAGTPLDEVQKTLREATAVVTGPGLHDEKLTALRTLARGLLDTKTMGRQAIGPVLEQQPPAQQDEFLELFDELIVRAYLQKLLFFRNPTFAYTGAAVEGDSARVNTKILTANDEFFVDYVMGRRDGRWWATDVIVERASLTRNYAAQFARLLRDESFGELLDRLRGKVRGLRAIGGKGWG